MTAVEPGTVKVHPGVVRATHWINVIAMAIMIGSG
jgi:Ni,Fe-hydrogenase I cytochrome b subunit